jgi:anthranilate phosphoribosyltransferase
MDSRTTWPALIGALLNGQSRSADETTWAMKEIMSGQATDVQIAGFAVALRAKGETVAEVGGLATGMLAHSTRVPYDGPAVDLVGTGGDQAHTVNISTMGAIVAAAAGATMVKHGNRAASSSCGAADVLEELGVTFCFAPLFHPALRYASRTRSELGTPTVFNFLGPLTNPARPAAQAVGVFHPRLAGITAGVFAERGCSSLVFRGDDGLDELTTTSTSVIWVVRDGTATETAFDPAELGIPRTTMEALRGGRAPDNARVARAVLGGEPGPVRDIVTLNAAAALVAADGAPPAENLTEALRDGHARAQEAIDSGRATALLDRWAALTRRLAS